MSSTKSRIPNDANEMLDVMSEQLPGKPTKTQLNGQAVREMYAHLVAADLIDDKRGLADDVDASLANR